jgi:hypothetical protein
MSYARWVLSAFSFSILSGVAMGQFRDDFDSPAIQGFPDLNHPSDVHLA